jgi:hypothetical protein
MDKEFIIVMSFILSLTLLTAGAFYMDITNSKREAVSRMIAGGIDKRVAICIADNRIKDTDICIKELIKVD